MQANLAHNVCRRRAFEPLLHSQRYILSGLQAVLAITFLIACDISSQAIAGAGDADPTFGGGVGYRTYAKRYDAPWLVTGMQALPDGSAILAGHAETNVYVRHYAADGTLDTAFGESGTTTIRDLPFVLRNRTEFDPRVQVLRAPGGAILVEQGGAVRRLSTDGRLDPSLSTQLNVTGGFAQPTILPQDDGRIVVVTGQQGTSDPKQISVRFYLPDGTKDTARGDKNGERLVYPAGEGVYIVYDAVTQPGGNILIAATLRRPSQSLGLVLVRILPTGALDATFGQGGQAIVAPQIGINTQPHVALGADGRIAYTFFVNDSPDYFVVYVLRADGAIDTSAPSVVLRN